MSQPALTEYFVAITTSLLLSIIPFLIATYFACSVTNDSRPTSPPLPANETCSMHFHPTLNEHAAPCYVTRLFSVKPSLSFTRHTDHYQLRYALLSTTHAQHTTHLHPSLTYSFTLHPTSTCPSLDTPPAYTADRSFHCNDRDITYNNAIPYPCSPSDQPPWYPG